MDTKPYYARLLDEVLVAGETPELAYQARARLRRAILALKRGPNGELSTPPIGASPAIARITRSLEDRVLRLCQPSEALDMRWREAWATVAADVRKLQRLIAEA
jgi:hypothetical protein